MQKIKEFFENLIRDDTMVRFSIKYNLLGFVLDVVLAILAIVFYFIAPFIVSDELIKIIINIVCAAFVFFTLLDFLTRLSRIRFKHSNEYFVNFPQIQERFNREMKSELLYKGSMVVVTKSFLFLPRIHNVLITPNHHFVVEASRFEGLFYLNEIAIIEVDIRNIRNPNIIVFQDNKGYRYAMKSSQAVINKLKEYIPVRTFLLDNTYINKKGKK